jgi:error-prone DNA polymerase
VRDVWLRTGLSAQALEYLAVADVFRSLGLDRRQALWAVRALDRKAAAERLPLFDRPLVRLKDLEPEMRLPTMPIGQHVIHDYQALGFSLKAHPVSFMRQRLAASGVLPNAALGQIPQGRRVTVAGLVLVRQRPGSAKGVIFMTLEDEKSIANIIVWPKTFERFRPLVLGARFIRVTGRLQSESDVIHVVAERIEDLTSWLVDLSEEAATIDTYARADEIKHGGGRDPRERAGFDRSARQPSLPGFAKDAAELTRATRKVLPKGRNFQ